MLVINGPKSHTCDGPTRREWMRVGSLGILGLSLPHFLEHQAKAATHDAPKIPARAKQVLLIFLQGGPSHIDIWDPKPDAPVEIRGPFGTIPSGSKSRRSCGGRRTEPPQSSGEGPCRGLFPF